MTKEEIVPISPCEVSSFLHFRLCKSRHVSCQKQSQKMEMLRSSFASVLGGAENTNAGPSSAETIERLVERLRCATLLEDRRDTCRALKAMSRKFRTEVGVQALE